MIGPGARTAVYNTKNKRVGVIATKGTIESKAYDKEIAGIDPDIKTFSVSAPLLVDFVETIPEASAIIRSLRNGDDLQYEMNQQYWNEDLGLTIPVVYFMCDRSLSHISSSAIRQITKIRGFNENNNTY